MLVLSLGRLTVVAATGSLLFRVPNPMALCQNHCALRNGSFASLQASLLKGIHLIQIAGHAGFETIFRVWPLLT